MSVSPPVDQTRTTAPPPRPSARGGPGRIISAVAGVLVGVIALVVLSVGGWATWATNTQRDGAGYLNADRHIITTSGHAITSAEVGELADKSWGGLLGTVRLRATSTGSGSPVLIGVAPTAAVDRYLAGAGRTAVTGWFPVVTHDVTAAGHGPNPAPVDSRIWTAHVSGPGTQALTWRPEAGTTVVVMHPDGSPGVIAAIDVGATVPDLVWVAVVCFAVGAGLLIASAVLVVVPVLRSRQRPRPRYIRSPSTPHMRPAGRK